MSELIQFDGLEDALLGVVEVHTKPPRLCYSFNGIIDVLMGRDGMTFEEAVEFFEFNIACLWAGEGTPAILYETTDLEPWLEDDQ